MSSRRAFLAVVMLSPCFGSVLADDTQKERSLTVEQIIAANDKRQVALKQAAEAEVLANGISTRATKETQATADSQSAKEWVEACSQWHAAHTAELQEAAPAASKVCLSPADVAALSNAHDQKLQLARQITRESAGSDAVLASLQAAEAQIKAISQPSEKTTSSSK